MIFNEDICLTTTINIPENADISVDLNGKTITVTKTGDTSLTAFNNYGNLTLLDSVGTGTMTARIAVDNYKTLVMNSGTLAACDAGGACIYNNPDCGSTFTMNGGTLKATVLGSPHVSSGCACIRNMAAAKTIINKGILDSISTRTYAIITNGELVISPKSKEDFSLTAYRGIAVDNGTAVIDEGTYTILDPRGLGVGAEEAYNAIYTWQGKNITINGGTFTAPTQIFWSTTATNKITVNGGIFNSPFNAVDDYHASVGDIQILGGTFTAPFNASDKYTKSIGHIKIDGGNFIEVPQSEFMSDFVCPTEENEGGTSTYNIVPYVYLDDTTFKKRKLNECVVTKEDLNKIMEKLIKIIDYRISLKLNN